MTVGFVVAAALSLVLLAQIADVLVASYARGVLRAALDEGVRAGARVEAATPACELRAGEVLDGLLGPKLRAGIGPVTCTDLGDQLTAAADAELRAWLPGVPMWRFSATATAVREPPP